MEREMMGDLISRNAVFDALIEKGQNSKRYKLGEKWELNLTEIIEAINAISSAESEERIAKVVEHDVSILIEGGYKLQRSEYLCTACHKKVIGGDDYCSHCGARLEWDDLGIF